MAGRLPNTLRIRPGQLHSSGRPSIAAAAEICGELFNSSHFPLSSGNIEKLGTTLRRFLAYYSLQVLVMLLPIPRRSLVDPSMRPRRF